MKETENTSSLGVEKLGGDSNFNLRLGDTLIKKIVYGNIDFIDDAYTQLLEHQLFGIISYQRFDDLVFLPYIEGDVTPDIEVSEFLELSERINNSGLTPRITLRDVFNNYNFIPDEELYADLLNNISYVSHGDLAYTNLVKTRNGLVPIDWELLCYSVKYWDLACFLTSLYIYNHTDHKGIIRKTMEAPEPKLAIQTTMLLCDYWIGWSISTNYDFFSKELKELKRHLLQHYFY